MSYHPQDFGCGCDGDCDRRQFLTALGTAAGAMSLMPLAAAASESVGASAVSKAKVPAVVRVAFIYPPSTAFSQDADGWWSWPGNDFDAEGREKLYRTHLAEIEKKFGLKLEIRQKPIADAKDASRFAKELQDQRTDGVLLVMFYNRSLDAADQILQAAEGAGIPAIFYIGLGCKHGPVTKYQRPGLYFIQSLDNFEALEYGLRMMHVKKFLGQSRLLSIVEAPEPREGKEAFFGINVRVVPFQRYADIFHKVPIDARAKEFIDALTRGAKEIRGVTPQALENAARAHFALTRLLEEHAADGLTMNCLRQGMLKPCISFSRLNNQLVPAACENDLPAVYTQLLGQKLLGRPGFQHNPCYDTEKNHYYASHCTCSTKPAGPEGPELPYLLRRFAHTNEGSCAIQVFWNPGDPVTMVRYYPGQKPVLDVYSGKVVQSHPMPPAAGCTTNVEIEITDRPDACMVRGHHNLLFSGDSARKFRLFANLYKIPLRDTPAGAKADGLKERVEDPV
jgi:hypothetical protein